MRIYSVRCAVLLTGGIFLIGKMPSASADQIRITITNNQPTGGFAITPFWAGLDNGGFSAFTPGTSASLGVENVAEIGSTGAITSAFAGQGVQATIGSGVVLPGGSISGVINVANPATNRYFHFLSMVVPSNDFFLGNANPLGTALFDGAGNFNGTQTIQLFGRDVWDAGTEVDDVNVGSAYIAGVNEFVHVAENGTVSSVFGGNNDLTSYLNSFNGRSTGGGYAISHLFSPNDPVATIQIASVPEPSSLLLLGVAVAVAFGLRTHGFFTSSSRSPERLRRAESRTPDRLLACSKFFPGTTTPAP